MVGKLPASQANAEVVSAFRREEGERKMKLLQNYLRVCSRAKVKASIAMVEANEIQKGIVDLVNRHGVRKLVMGAVPEKKVYEDDEDHGEWFLYTGSGGRDPSGNKRTNKAHTFDQKLELRNQALRVSCLQGYPVRVVRRNAPLCPRQQGYDTMEFTELRNVGQNMENK